MQVDEASSLSF